LIQKVRLERNRGPDIERAQLYRSLDHSGWDATAQGFISGQAAHMSNDAARNMLLVQSNVPRTGVSHRFGTADPDFTYTLSFSARSTRRTTARLRFALEDNFERNGPVWTESSIGRSWRRYSLSWRPSARSPDARLYVWQPEAPVAFAIRDVRIVARSGGGERSRTHHIGVRLLGSGYTAEQRQLREITGASERYYVESRSRGARLALSAFADEPIHGIGWERFTSLSLRRLPFGPLPTHDEYLRFLAELGIGGLVLLLVLGGAAFAALRSQPPGRLRTATTGALTGAAVSLLFINGLVVPSAGLWVVVVCCVAVAGAAARRAPADGARSESKVSDSGN
jgi:hypothetical protein